MSIPVRQIQPGEAVSAAVASRPDVALTGRTDSLQNQIDAINSGRSIVDSGATIDPLLLPGQPVFWNSDTQRYEQALAAVENDLDLGTFVPKASSVCVGLLLVKTSANQGDVILGGITQLAVISNAIDGEIVPGRYYLSSVSPGKLVRARPDIGIPVCVVLGPVTACDSTPGVIVDPRPTDFLSSHVHYGFRLHCRPAGDSVTPPSMDDKHVITNPDPALRGWLPANHHVFNGTAPHGAVFGYNIALDPELDRAWPPIPLQAVAAVWDRGLNELGGVQIPVGSDGLMIVTVHGIWWTSDCWGDAPWPTTYDSSDPPSESLSLSSSAADVPACPREEVMRLTVYFLRMLYGNDHNVVTSLKPATGSPITITNCGGTPATTGDLQLGINIDSQIDPTETVGSLVLKTVNNQFQFREGHVTEGLLAGSDRVTISGTTTRHLDPADSGSPIVYQGVITLDVAADPSAKELPAELVRLNDAAEVFYRDIPCIGFPAGRSSSIRARINIPAAGLPVNPQISIRAELFGLVSATLPVMVLSYRRIARPAPTTALPVAADNAVGFAANVAVTANTLIEVNSDTFPVAAGDTLLVSLSRDVSAGYSGDVELLRLVGVISGG